MVNHRPRAENFLSPSDVVVGEPHSSRLGTLEQTVVGCTPKGRVGTLCDVLTATKLPNATEPVTKRHVTITAAHRGPGSSLSAPQNRATGLCGFGCVSFSSSSCLFRRFFFFLPLKLHHVCVP